MRASRRVLDAAIEKAYDNQRAINWVEALAGEKAFNKTGEWLPLTNPRNVQKISGSHKGPLNNPHRRRFPLPERHIETSLDLYVCIRPVRWFNGVPSPVKEPSSVDMVIFRENTEDIYAGIEFEEGTAECKKFLSLMETNFPDLFQKIRFPDTSGIGLKPVSQEGTTRLVRAATNYAIANGRKSLTFVHKGNIMKFTEGAFRNWGYDYVEKEYPDNTYTWEQWEKTKAAESSEAANLEQEKELAKGKILVKDAIADITLQQVLTRPKEFDVIATMNLNGDYLSDALAAQVGGIGIAPGGNVNYETGHAIFEATHGTAPKYANLDKVNPGSVLLSGEMMLRYLGWTEAADLIIATMDKTISSRFVTYDFARLMDNANEVKCSEFATKLIENL